MTNQEIFDRVLTHLREQGHAAVAADGSCWYRAENGDMCAVGCLIPDSAYDARIEGRGLDDLKPDDYPDSTDVLVRVLRQAGLSDESYSLLTRLQYAHDDTLYWQGVVAFESHMAHIAGDFHLKYRPAK